MAPGFPSTPPRAGPLLTHLSTACLPCVFLQADLNTNIEDEGSSFYGVSSQYESPENMIITCSTKVCSFGKQVVEKVEVGTPLPHVLVRPGPPLPQAALHPCPQIYLSLPLTHLAVLGSPPHVQHNQM